MVFVNSMHWERTHQSERELERRSDSFYKSYDKMRHVSNKVWLGLTDFIIRHLVQSYAQNLLLTTTATTYMIHCVHRVHLLAGPLCLFVSATIICLSGSVVHLWYHSMSLNRIELKVDGVKLYRHFHESIERNTYSNATNRSKEIHTVMPETCITVLAFAVVCGVTIQNETPGTIADDGF